MAIKGLSLTEEETYICRDDPDIVRLPNGEIDVDASLRAGATGFIHQPIPSGIMSRIQDMTQVLESEFGTNKQRVVYQNAQKCREAFKYGIKEFINFTDRKGRPIEALKEVRFEGGRSLQILQEEVLDRVPNAIISEVGQAIIKANSMTEEQGKNFEALLSQFGASNTSSAQNVTEETNSEEGTRTDGSKTDLTESQS